MMKKIMMIVVDGMRPDALTACGHPFVDTMKEEGLYTLTARTVMPSVTLPCHMSLFHSVPPERHGIMTNTYVPQVRPVQGLCEVLRAGGKASAFFYTWHELRDLTGPDSLAFSTFINLHTYENTDNLITDRCIAYLNDNDLDFVFLYLGETDMTGHKLGWMTDEYIKTVYNAVDNIERVYNRFKDYTIIVTADHGGHGRMHGSDMPEDMTIPLFILGEGKGTLPPEIGIMDIAPTIVKLLGLTPDSEWEGKPLL